MKKLVRFVPPALLVVVALHQIYLSRAQQLSPWKGGGFGMFSSTEMGPVRYLRVFVVAPNRSEELNVPESLIEAAQRATILPSDSILQSFAKKVASRELRHDRPVENIRMEVWRTRFDVVTLQPEEEKLRDYVFKMDQSGP